MTNKKTETPDTDPQIPAIKPSEAVQPDPDYPTVQGFATRLEQLMNEAYQQSQVEGELQQKFADWCNHLGDLLGDLWREVKSHAQV